ncbi:MAG: argininosuccinate lyase [Betaproteobacteria bacterium]|nr:argininosuccinate lyase [Betaproteobacteria bacterium]
MSGPTRTNARAPGATPAAEPATAKDINEVFRGGGRSVEFLDQINKASIVMLDAAGIVPHPVAGRIAKGIAQVIAQECESLPRRSADYLDYEPRLTAVVGPDASRLHTGRSRQDIASAIARMNLRDGLLKELEALITARGKLLAVASRHTETIVPAYTHGVQAQPTTFAHYLHALAAALGRQTERLQQAYQRINRNPLGAAALATSSFPIDRERLAVLLGFEGLVENAYDANHLAPVDSSLDVASALAIAAVQIGQFAQDIHAQYAEPTPWFMLATGELTGVSSIMPQKRNPAALEQLRAQASIMLGEMQTVFLIAHNNRTGMFDYRSYDPVPCARPLQVFKLLQQVVDGIVVNKARALAEVEADYSTTTEIADALMQEADVPFRIGHHFASKLTDYGRAQDLKLHEIPYAEAARIYEAETKQAFPLSEMDFRNVISAEHMVFGRRGIGGPQPAEVDRMLSNERASVASDRAWLKDRSDHLARAAAALDRGFVVLAG